MRRRTVLRTIGATGSIGLIALAGCIEDAPVEDAPFDGGQDGGDRDDNETDSGDDTDSTPEDDETGDGGQPTLVDTTLSSNDCVDVEVTFHAETVEVVGCVQGNNSCHEPKVEGSRLDGDTYVLTIKSEDTSEMGEACLDVITHNGYQVTATFEDGLPAEVEVNHSDMKGDGTVTTVER